MAGGQERILRRRIRSVQSTKKITRAMELIAASRIQKAQQRVHAAVPYSEGIAEVVRDLAASGGAAGESPLLAQRDHIRCTGYLAIAADRGLCGGYNGNIVRTAEAEMREHARHGQSYKLYTVGRKVEGYFRYRDYSIEGSYSGFSEAPTYEDARRIGQDIVSTFLSSDLDLVRIIYTRFVTAGTQEVVDVPLLPLDRRVLQATGVEVHRAEYEYEPSTAVILDALLPRYVEARIYAALLNASASEQAARQRAMKAATDNADELVKALSRQMNRARQDSITTEIMEIVSGAEAQRGDDQLADAFS